MRPIARIGDLVSGTCSCHQTPQSVSGVIVAGSGVTTAHGQAVARIGDLVSFSCGHTAIIAAGSGIVFCDGIGVAHIGDSVVGCVNGVIVGGDGNVIAAWQIKRNNVY